MRITSVETGRRPVHLRLPFRTALREVKDFEVVTVSVRAEPYTFSKPATLADDVMPLTPPPIADTTSVPPACTIVPLANPLDPTTWLPPLPTVSE